jgi:FixJ family two-component response regulator
MAVSAIKMGAFDFIEKPCDETCLLASVINAAEHYREQMSSAVGLEQLRSRFSSLSPRQLQVMELVVAGLSSKEIGMRLNLSAKTVNNHRAWSELAPEIS